MINGRKSAVALFTIHYQARPKKLRVEKNHAVFFRMQVKISMLTCAAAMHFGRLFEKMGALGGIRYSLFWW
jgi:hypothetical protein